jgi:hypothetical protein
VIHIVDELVNRKIRFTAIKESIHFEGKQDLQTTARVAQRYAARRKNSA